MAKLANQYFEVQITKTGKPMGNSQHPYRIFDEERQKFGSIQAVKDWLKEHYGNCKRVKMFRDLPQGQTRQIGWVYCFKNADWSHTPIEQWWQQDWIEIQRIKATPIVI
jgi:hypothetical protein